MSIIELDRKFNVLRIGNNSRDIKRYVDVTVLYDITHVVNFCDDGWYDIYRGETRVGHLTDVEDVKEKW